VPSFSLPSPHGLSHLPALVPFLLAREGFHPKRNKARQNFATLSRNRFRDLSCDVYHELLRRYPEFKEEAGLIFSFLYCSQFILPLSPLQPADISMTLPGSDPSDFPSRGLSITPRNRGMGLPAPTQVSKDRGHPPSGERMPSEYEYGISTMQSHIVSLKRQIGGVEVHLRQLEQSYPLFRQLEDEFSSCRRVCLIIAFVFFFLDARLNLAQRAEEQRFLILALQKELDDVHEEAQRSRERGARRAQMDEEELQTPYERFEKGLALAVCSVTLPISLAGSHFP
jgi:Spa2 homology domain (SHD) of GIT